MSWLREHEFGVENWALSSSSINKVCVDAGAASSDAVAADATDAVGDYAVATDDVAVYSCFYKLWSFLLKKVC